MVYKSLLLVLVCVLAGSRASYQASYHPKVVHLPVQTELYALRHQLTSCIGKLVCGVNQTHKTTTVQCLNADLICDGIRQCQNGVDEHGCERRCEGKVICPDRKTCAIPCDGVMSCAGGEDEKNCLPMCEKPKVLCDDLKTCATICNGMMECPNGGVDEKGCGPTCPAGQMLCADGKTCGKPCDGTDQCPGAGDELNCPFQCRCTRGQYICKASDKCLPRNQVCNDKAHPREKIEESCFAGRGVGDDESNNQFGTECS